MTEKLKEMLPRDMFLAVFAVALWGCNFVAAREALNHFPPLYLMALRFALLSILVIPFVKRPDAENLKKIFLLSIILGTGHFGLLFASLYYGLDIASAAIVVQLGAPISCILGAIFFHDRMGIWRISGMVISFSGVVLILGAPNIAGHMFGFTLAFVGAAAWAVSNIVLKRIHGVPIFSTLGWMSLFSMPQLFILSLLTEQHHLVLLKTVSFSVVLALMYTVFCSTLVAYGLWYHMLKKYDVSQVVPFSLLNPFFAIGAGQLFFNEPLTTSIVVGGILTILGVAIIVIRRPKFTLFGKSAGE